MNQQGNIPGKYIWQFAGNPTGISTSVINPPLGALVVDSTTGAIYRKTTGYGNNSGFVALGNATVPSNAPIQPPQEFVDAVMAGYNPIAGIRVSGAIADPNANGDYAVAPATQYAGRRVWRSIAKPDYWMFFDDDGWSIQINNTGTFDPAGGQVYFEDSADLTLGDMVPWLYSQPQQWLIAATDHDHDSLTLVFFIPD